MRKRLFLISGLFLITGVNRVYAQPDVDRATREMDRSVREEVEEELEVIPRPPVIKMEGSVGEPESPGDRKVDTGSGPDATVGKHRE